MKSKALFLLPAFGLLTALALFLPCRAPAGGIPSNSGYTVLAPIRHGNLTVFPVVAAHSFDTGDFLTLDEGLRSGEVIVTESGSVQPLIRRRRMPPSPGGAQVNQLVLVNNSKRPLILLAGEIVTGGKQDRVIGKDRIIPPESDPMDLESSASNRAGGLAAATDSALKELLEHSCRPQWQLRMSAPRRWPTRTSRKSGPR